MLYAFFKKIEDWSLSISVIYVPEVYSQAHFPFQYHFWNQILLWKVNTSTESTQLLLVRIAGRPCPGLSVPAPGLYDLGSAK